MAFCSSPHLEQMICMICMISSHLHALDIPVRPDVLPILYDLARVAGWDPCNLHILLCTWYPSNCHVVIILCDVRGGVPLA